MASLELDCVEANVLVVRSKISERLRKFGTLEVRAQTGLCGLMLEYTGAESQESQEGQPVPVPAGPPPPNSAGLQSPRVLEV